MRMRYLVSGLLLALVMSSGAFAGRWSTDALQRAYFAQVAQISGGIVQPFKDENNPPYVYANAIFEVDLEGNGSKYIASYGKANVDIRSTPPGIEISDLLTEKPTKLVRKGEAVILILNSRKGKLTIMPSPSGANMSVQIRPLRWKGKNRHIPDDAKSCMDKLPQDRDAVSYGDSGTNVLIYYRKRWKLHFCEIE